MIRSTNIITFAVFGIPLFHPFILFMFLSFSSTSFSSEETAFDLKGSTLVAAISPDYPPTSFRNIINGKAEGFAVEVINAMAAKDGFQVKYIFYETRDTIEEAVLSGKADIAPNLIIDEKRLKKLIFTQPVEALNISLIARASDFKNNKIESGTKIGVIKGTSASNRLENRKDIVLISYPNAKHLLIDLLNGQIDLALTAVPSMVQTARDAKIEGHIRVIEPPLYEAKRAIALRPDNGVLKNLLDRSIIRFVNSPEYLKIYRKWYGDYASFLTPVQVAWIIVTTIFLMLLIFLIIRRQERRVSNSFIAESEMKFRLLFENSVDGIFLISPDNRILALNHTFAEMHGYTTAEMMRMNLDDLATAESLCLAPDRMAKCLAGDAMNFEAEHYCRNGRIITLDVSINKLTLKGNIYILGVHRDISELKKKEQEILNLNASLEKKVIQRTAEIENANKELEAFTFTVSHDLRAPLRIIDGFSKFLQDDHGQTLNSEAARFISIIRSNTQRMDQLITDLLAFSMVTKCETRFSRIDMNTLIKTTIEDAVTEDVKPLFTFTINPVPDAWGDMRLIRQVWFNLISNAVKYTMKSNTKEILIGSLKNNDQNVYFIKDTGVGFNEEYKDKLFRLFQRLHSIDDFEGTGVGLAIVQRIITRHKGCVWGEGYENNGAKFSFSLPIDQQNA